MANEAAEQPGSLLRSVTRMLDSALNEGTNYESLIPVLSLVCLVSILNRNQSAVVPQVASASPANPIQKLLGDLGKGEGGLGPDTLMSLLPLLNSPQLKNKLNPSTLSTIFGLINSMNDKGESKQEKQEKAEHPEKNEESHDSKHSAPPAAAVTSMEVLGQNNRPEQIDPDKKGLGRYLNWKNSF